MTTGESPTLRQPDAATPWGAIAGVTVVVSVFAIAQGLSYPLLSFILTRQGTPSSLIGLSAAMTPCGLIAAAPLSACDSKDGTSFTMNTSDSDGNTTVSADGKTGQVALNVPGFSGKITLPKMHLDGNDLDLNGVHLYPGSKITTMNVDAKNNDEGVVHVAFTSPADPQVVRDWFGQLGVHARPVGA